MIKRIAASVALGGMVAVSASSSSAGELDCVLEPNSVVRVGSAVEGIIASTHADRGDFVEAGDLLARLESSVEEAQVELARLRAESMAALHSSEVRRDYQQIEYDRIAKLYEKGVASKGALDEVETELTLAELEVDEREIEVQLAELEYARAKAVLERRRIHAPISGVVTERALSAGEYIYEQSELVTIAGVDPLHVEAYAPLALYGAIAVGMESVVKAVEPVGGSHMATVTVVDSVADAASGTFGVRLELANPGAAIPAGIRCRVEFPDAP